MAQFQNYDKDHQAYLNKIRNLPLLTPEQEYKLAKEWREDQSEKAVEHLINSHLRLVDKIASGYRGYGLPLQELIAEGNVGIMQAVKHYNPELGYRFSTYAMWWIKASIKEYIMQNWSSVKIGTTKAQKKLFFGLRKAMQEIRQENETEASLTPENITALAEKLGVKEEEIISMHQRLKMQDASLNQTMSQDSEKEWIDTIPDGEDSLESKIAHKDEFNKLQKILKEALHCLNKREHEIIVCRRLKDPPETLEQLSIKLNLSRERVRQIENSAFAKLSKHMKELSLKHDQHKALHNLNTNNLTSH